MANPEELKSSPEEGRVPNRLGRETSPYLLQHRFNPIDWYPWGREAQEKARRENKPIFLSVGYSSCHWCHVMARESFSNPEIAKYLNQNYVCVKVDREEHPDVDAVYMEALLAFQGQGGWPLSAFLDPELKPFAAGTYFPPDRFQQVLTGVREVYDTHRDEVDRLGQEMLRLLGEKGVTGQKSVFQGPEGKQRARKIVLGVTKRLLDFRDPEWGGFGRQPKFPHPLELRLLLHQAWSPQSPGEIQAAKSWLDLTLEKMGNGGLFDVLAGGFARYSVEPTWMVPHFEKMLYDNAQLALIYAEHWLLSGNGNSRRIAERTFDFLLREMQHPDGGFYSAWDADSEGVEGKFYTWDYREWEAIVGDRAAWADYYFGVQPAGNFEGVNILSERADMEQTRQLFAKNPGQAVGQSLKESIEKLRSELRVARGKRPRPGLDNKIIVSWNCLAIRALLKGGIILNRPDYVAAGRQGLDFILNHCQPGEKNKKSPGKNPISGLSHSWTAGSPGPPALAEDYALLGSAVLEAFFIFDEERYGNLALDCARELRTSFREGGGKQNGKYTGQGPYLRNRVGTRADEFLLPPINLSQQTDGVMPSVNSAALEFFDTMYHVTLNQEYQNHFWELVESLDPDNWQVGMGYGGQLWALSLGTSPEKRETLVFTDSKSWESMRHLFIRKTKPGDILMWRDPNQVSDDSTESRLDSILLKGKWELARKQRDKGLVFDCEAGICHEPLELPVFVDSVRDAQGKTVGNDLEA